MGIITAELGHRLYFITAMELARKLGVAYAQNRLGYAIKTLTQPKLLIIDEIGYLGLDSTQASPALPGPLHPLRAKSRRHPHLEQSLLRLARCLRWDAVLASAALDRLLHRSTILNIKGESYRPKEKRQAGLLPNHHLPPNPKPTTQKQKT